MYHDESIAAPTPRAVLPSQFVSNANCRDGKQEFARGDDTDSHRLPDTRIQGHAGSGIALSQQIAGDLYNLTACGCSIRLYSGTLSKDDEVWFRIDTIKPWKGTVRWVIAANVGVEFESPLFPSRFELVTGLRHQAEFAKA